MFFKSLTFKDLSTLNSLQSIIYQSNNQYNKLQQDIIKEEQFNKRPLSTKAKFKYFADSEATNDISNNLQVKGNIWVTISVGNDEKYWTGTSKPLLMSFISPFTEIANFGSPAQTIPTFSYSNGSFYVFLHNRILKGDRTGNFQELGTIPTSDTFWSALVYNDNIYMGTITKKLFKGNKNGNFQELTNWTGGMIWSLAVYNNNFYLGTDKGKVFLVKDSNTFEEIFSVPDSGAKIIRIGSFNNSLYVGVNYGTSNSKLFKESTVGNFTELSNFDKNINDMIFVNNNIYIALQNGEVLKSDSTGNFNLFFNLLAGIRNLVFYNNNFYASNFAGVIFKINPNGSFYEFNNFNSNLIIILEVVDDYLYALTTASPFFFTAKENNKLSLVENVLNKFWKAKLI